MPSVEQQIEQSRAKKKALIKKALLGCAVVLFVGMASVVLISFMPSVSTDVDLSVDKTETVHQPSESPSSTSLSPEERKALQMALSDSKQRVSELVQRVTHSKEFSEKVNVVEDELNKAFNAYSSSNFSEVETALEVVNGSVSALSAEYENAYTAPYESALSAFEKDDISEAFNLNRVSLTTNPDFEKAKILQQRIDVYSEVQDAYEQARVGRVENNIQKQRDAYAEIVALDPFREDSKQALDAIERQIRENRFNTLLASANKAIEARDFTTATQRINEAKSLKSSSSELDIISKKLASLIAGSEQQKIESQVTLFADADEWKTVQMLANKGLTSFSASPTLLQAKQDADGILNASKRLEAYQQRPERLSDNNVRNLAQQDIEQARNYANKSAKLLTQITELEGIVDKIKQPRPVTITSDNDTYIKVLGVGVVGEIKRKTIQLKPGTYRVEGSREGYRSTIKEIVVSPSDNNPSVHIVCTEKV
ncbi:hypothetical protein KUL150_22250 [Alteromonas sp. KUL150]|uniref:hypothetical protein n=1 Tax=Alteromonas sp. KUL150 TaxID=2480805 RepID=UPI0012E611B6|nr:hypothetical protein [Alteromonas sp. KUL150]GFD86166.1 hypothetical protein KUL150_22250 [Alteromonas sp. KUL150]